MPDGSDYIEPTLRGVAEQLGREHPNITKEQFIAGLERSIRGRGNGAVKRRQEAIRNGLNFQWHDWLRCQREQAIRQTGEAEGLDISSDEDDATEATRRAENRQRFREGQRRGSAARAELFQSYVLHWRLPYVGVRAYEATRAELATSLSKCNSWISGMQRNTGIIRGIVSVLDTYHGDSLKAILNERGVREAVHELDNRFHITDNETGDDNHVNE